MSFTDWLLLLFLSVLWGTTFFFAAIALRDLPPVTLVLARVAIAALVLVIISHASGYRLPGTLADWRPFAVLALLNNLIPFSLIFIGQTRISSALASVLNATTPLFTLLVARALVGEPLPGHKLAGIGVGIGGVAVLMGPDLLTANRSSLLGTGCVLGGALSYAFAALWMRQLRRVPPLLVAAAQVTCSTIMLLPLAALIDRFWELPPPGTPAIVAIFGLAVFGTALAYIVFFRISASAGPSNVMLVTLLIPATATALATLVLGEQLASHQAFGALAIAAGLLVIDGRALARLQRQRLKCADSRRSAATQTAKRETGP
jgi:drug/metabolite transporter (DMT)-like permease